jgi:hypothetical protein
MRSPRDQPSGLSRAQKNQRAARDHQKHPENFWNFDDARRFHDHFLATDLKFTLPGRHAEIGMNQRCNSSGDQQDAYHGERVNLHDTIALTRKDARCFSSLPERRREMLPQNASEIRALGRA